MAEIGLTIKNLLSNWHIIYDEISLYRRIENIIFNCWIMDELNFFEGDSILTKYCQIYHIIPISSILDLLFT